MTTTRRIMNGYVNPADIGNNFNDTDSYKFTHDGCMPEKVMGCNKLTVL